MPYINIRIATRLTPDQRAQLFQQTTDAMDQIMGKRRDVTVVHIDESDADGWSVNGEPLQAQSPVAVYVEVKITLGTNSDAEQAALISTLMERCRHTIGTVQEACYVVVHEIKPTSWGFDGITQAERAARTVSGGG
ncbi:tautomerase family protein [Sedimenticola sp.]|uniref:tautomerase family protein n=1 Tax=Sedimenticola sp. TaxID=1940285 RepID=UPI003D0F6CD7